MRTRRTGLVPRTKYVRDARLFVLATEGEETEKQYFSLFRSPRVHVEILPTGSDGRSAPKHVLERLVKFKDQDDLGEEDELWLIVDVDRQRPQFLNEITRDARSKGCFLGISNPCFELWLLLHFRETDPADRDCGMIEDRLRQHLGSYNKAKLNLALFHPAAIQAAIQRAKSPAADPERCWPELPGTHVYKVVEKLLLLSPV